MTRFVELGQVLEEGMVGVAGFRSRIVGSLSMSPADPLQHAEVDTPREISLAAVAGVPGLVVDASVPPRAIALQFGAKAVQDKAVLIHTGWDEHWGTEAYREAAPYLASQTIDLLLHGGAALVGVDFCSTVGHTGQTHAAHARLLRAGVLIVENLCNLSALPSDGFRFFAVPLRIVGGASVPVRAFAELLPR